MGGTFRKLEKIPCLHARQHRQHRQQLACMPASHPRACELSTFAINARSRTRRLAFSKNWSFPHVRVKKIF
jgi:hypothetical protein